MPHDILPLRTALIGCGVMGEHYARVLAACDHACLVAVCDADEAKAHAFASRRGVAAVFGDYGALLAAGELDAVIVATPDFAHTAPVCAALRAGLPVLCEKPLATALADADAIVAAQEASGVPLMVNFGNRHRLNALRVRRLIQAGEIGRVEHVSIRLNERLCKTKQIAWLARTSPVWFLLSHCVDLVRWLLEDDFAAVFARATEGVVSQLAPGVPDVVTALCTTAGGATVHLESSWIMPDAYARDIEFALEVIGEQGVVHADLFPHDLELHRHDGACVQDYSMGITLPSGGEAGWWEASTLSFFSALVSGRTPTPTAQEGREVTRTLLALDESLRAGRAVDVAAAA